MFQTPNISKPPKTQQFYAILAIQTLLFKQTMKTQDPATGSARLLRHFQLESVPGGTSKDVGQRHIGLHLGAGSLAQNRSAKHLQRMSLVSYNTYVI